MSVPTHLYRYQTCAHLDWLEPIILRHELYFPTAAELNDPLDCRARIAQINPRELVRFLMKKFHQANPRATVDELSQASETIYKGIENEGIDWLHAEVSSYFNEGAARTRVLSFTTRWTNMSMWAQYADNHRGYCLEFAYLGTIARMARPVIYSDPVALDLASTSVLTDALEMNYRKSTDWINEDEYRVVGPTTAPSRLEIDPTWLTRIILGKDMKKAHRDTIGKWCRLRVPSLVVAEAKFNQLEQKLELA